MRIQILALTLLLGLVVVGQALDAKAKSEDSSSSASAQLETEATKDKRQVSSKETPIYPNHRSSAAEAAADDPEDGQESIYGSKPNQFIIRPIAPHQHQQHESHQEPQLRNFAAANSRPHAAQLLEQSQEHYVYLQDIQRHQPKALASGTQGKTATQSPKKATPVAEEQEQEQEAEQRYAVSIQPQPGLRGGPYAQPAYQLPLPLPAPHHQHQQQQQHPQQQQQQQQYQIIPEEQFLKILEEELQARAYHEQLRQQQQQQHQQQQQQQHQQHQQQQQQQRQPSPQPKLLPVHSTAATHKVLQQAEPILGLGGYRDRYVAEQQLVQPSYSRGGPKYLPLPQSQEEEESQAPVPQQRHPPQQQRLIAALPPQIAYYQPQISYKTLPNHPLAKSSLESEIEKLLAANKPGAGQQALAYVDSSNEPTLVNHQQHVTRLPPPQHPPAPTSHPALRQPKAYLASTPNSLLDANNQPFVPSLFKFSNFQQPTPIYPGPQPEGKRLGPVIYPTGAPAQPQPSQYYYQEASPTPVPKPKHYRTKQYKLPTPSPTKSYEKALLYADYAERAQPPSPAPTNAHFYPSPPDPIKHVSHGQQRTVVPTVQPIDYPAHPSPSQSSIYVSQGTGIATPSRVTPTAATVHKLRTLDEVKQLNLPPPNGKPLTQAEFQALVEAGYPVKAVPVPVPVPYEQYVKDHPEYRNHPPVDYAHLMRLATRQLTAHQHQHQHQLPHQRAAPSEPSVKILSSPSSAEAPQQTATGIGGGSVTYLQRRPRDEQDTAVAGSETKATAPAEPVAKAT
ncbi:mediator of RNA polymerase II transcription subunit 15 isoform X2 [Drosophila navojoa]|uniref:mediator of RNA polymerase II transcription subunit 15 isoform X2 n=1 Tax=Drosophila navojoa TaxID=7232 RepID=UPI0011BFCD64|nr:mediator of RNA polymerase II transcription subunit 15 isoform X2 [Drosophila navojoa]